MTAEMDPLSTTANHESARRQEMWNNLLSRGGPLNVLPELLHELGIYGGAQGIYIDVTHTRTPSAPSGIAVGLLHTGTSYADDLDETGVLYHYPNTQRAPGRDKSEINATKAARSENLPVFVITHSAKSKLRDVRRGWVQDWDDSARIFIVSFADLQPPELPSVEQEDQTPFTLVDHRNKGQRVTNTRPGQPTFKFLVMRRYSAACMVCGIVLPELLDAAHIRDKQHLGSDDPRNGLLLCGTHHRAYDRHYFAIDPDTMQIVARPQGPTLDALRITAKSINNMKRKPHPEALRWRWEQWLSKRLPPKGSADPLNYGER